MHDYPAAELGASRDCKTHECPNEAKNARGRYGGLCDDCIERNKTLSTAPRPEPSPKPIAKTGGLEANVKQLAAAAKNADKLAAHAKKLTERALAAKANADGAAENVRRLARELMGDE